MHITGNEKRHFHLNLSLTEQKRSGCKPFVVLSNFIGFNGENHGNSVFITKPLNVKKTNQTKATTTTT